MKVTITTLLAVLFFINQSNAQPFTFYQTNDAPKVIKPGTVSDTLLNPFAGGLNNPQFSNIDWNGDRKQDLFVFDKETLRPMAFLYNSSLKKFTHAPEFEGGFKNYFSGWATLRDLNEDGKPDLIISSSAFNRVSNEFFIEGTYLQTFFNRSKNGKPKFEMISNFVTDTGMYVGPPFNEAFPESPLGTQPGAVMAIDDMDGDGDIDMLLTESEFTSFSYLENLKKNKYNIIYHPDSLAFVKRDNCWGFTRYNFMSNSFELGIPYSSNSMCVYNSWDKRNEKKSSKHKDQAMNFLDLNGDGYCDLIFADYEYKTMISAINGRVQANYRHDSIISQDTLFLSKTNNRRVFMEYPASFNVDLDADGKKEFVVTTAANLASKTKDNIWVFDTKRVGANLTFEEREGNAFLYEDMIDFGSRNAPVLVDIDADGDQDLVVATSGNLAQTNNNTDVLYLFRNVGSTNYPVFKLVDTNFAAISQQASTGFFAAHPTFGDLNGDGKLDLLIGEGNGSMAFFINDGTTTEPNFRLDTRNFFSILNGTYATPQLVDLNLDGLLDIVSGQTNGVITYYQNSGTSTSPQFSATPSIDSVGKIVTKEVRKAIGTNELPDYFGYSAPHILDIDNDGIWDLVSGSYSGQLWVYKGIYANKDSVAKRMLNPFNDYSQDRDSNYNKRFGLRNTVTSAKLNSDSFPDLIVGTLSGGLIYLSTRPNPANGVADFEVNNKAIEVFPNPTSSSFNIKFNEVLPSDAKYILVDLMGRKVKEGEINRTTLQPTIETDSIPAGLYLFQLQTSKWQATQRIVITR